MPSEILLKTWLPNIEKFQIRKAFSTSAPGEVVIITPDTCWCPKLMVWLLQERRGIKDRLLDVSTVQAQMATGQDNLK